MKKRIVSRATLVKKNCGRRITFSCSYTSVHISSVVLFSSIPVDACTPQRTYFYEMIRKSENELAQTFPVYNARENRVNEVSHFPYSSVPENALASGSAQSPAGLQYGNIENTCQKNAAEENAEPTEELGKLDAASAAATQLISLSKLGEKMH